MQSAQEHTTRSHLPSFSLLWAFDLSCTFWYQVKLSWVISLQPRLSNSEEPRGTIVGAEQVPQSLRFLVRQSLNIQMLEYDFWCLHSVFFFILVEWSGACWWTSKQFRFGMGYTAYRDKSSSPFTLLFYFTLLRFLLHLDRSKKSAEKSTYFKIHERSNH